MANVSEITTMCRNGQVQEAYDMAKHDLELQPADVWLQRALGWALYYMMKNLAERGDYEKLLECIDELKTLDQITSEDMVFDNVQFPIANFIRLRGNMSDIEASTKLSMLFQKLKDYTFNPSRGHSFLLQVVIKYESWSELADFLDWWNLDNLTEEDYTPFVNQKGQKMMTLAERAFIANSKALLKLHDAGRIEEFLPKLDTLMNQHEDMMYPGYFYGKLLLALGENMNEALKVLIPFAQKKITEFWVWQLLSDVFVNDKEKQLACLLRAVHCRTQEVFLGKVRTKLAALYIERQLFANARYHIDAVVRCYASQGWRLPNEIDCWIHQPWITTTVPDAHDPVDYKTITDDILCNGAEECVAVVTYVDQKNHKATMIYGYHQRMTQKMRFKVTAGNTLKLHYIKDKEGKIRVLTAGKSQLSRDNDYAKYVDGTIDKREEKEFAFLKTDSCRYFVSPAVVKKNNLKNGDHVRSLIVCDYDKKKNSWNWVCVNVKK